MTITELLILLVVAGACGAVARALAGHTQGGFLVSIGVGFVGAMIGRWLASAVELPDLFSLDVGDSTIPIGWTIIGSALFVVVLTAIQKSKSD